MLEPRAFALHYHRIISNRNCKSERNRWCIITDGMVFGMAQTINQELHLKKWCIGAKCKRTLGCRALGVNDPRISNNILPSVDKMQCSTHKYGWDEKWIGQNRGDTSGTEKDLCSWKSVMVVHVGPTVLRLHYDVCARKSLCQGCFCSPSHKNELFIYVPCPKNTAPIDWGNWSWLGCWCSWSSVYLMEHHILADVDTNAWWSICSEQKCLQGGQVIYFYYKCKQSNVC